MHALQATINRARETFWVLPAIAIVIGMALGLGIPALDPHVSLPDPVAFDGQEDTARTILTIVATIGVSTAGVSFSVIVVALVLASQQLSPRVLSSFQRQTLNQAVLAVLLGSAVFALFTLGAIGGTSEQPVPEVAVTLAMLSTAAALGLFVVFLHHAVRSLNASVVIRRIAADGHQAIADPYPHGVGRAAAPGQAWEPSGAAVVEVLAPRAGYVAAVDGRRLVTLAAAADAVVEQRRAIGTFAVTGAVLAVVHGGRDVEPEDFADAFMLHEERVVDGDIAFPIRQLADIALKGLSPGVNDPTTAENAMDSVTDTLVRFARRDPLTRLRLDEDGVPRLVATAPTLDDLVRLAFDQVRRDAADRPSFAVRLLELLADLRDAGDVAGDCREIARQAELICEHAASVAEHQADQRLVRETYERLHRPPAATRA